MSRKDKQVNNITNAVGSQLKPERPDSTLDSSSRRLLLSAHLQLFIKRLRHGREVAGTELLNLLPLTIVGEGQPSTGTADRFDLQLEVVGR